MNNFILGERSTENCYVIYMEYDTRTDEVETIEKHVSINMSVFYVPFCFRINSL